MHCGDALFIYEKKDPLLDCGRRRQPEKPPASQHVKRLQPFCCVLPSVNTTTQGPFPLSRTVPDFFCIPFDSSHSPLLSHFI